MERKLDETLTEYYKAFYAMCKRVTGRRLTEEEENLPISVDPISEERASRCLARIDLLSKIREEILPNPELDERLKLCQHSIDLPDWWVCGKHDKDLITGAAKYGLNRLDFNLMNDPELSFIEIVKQFEQSNLEKKNESNIESKKEIVNNNEEETEKSKLVKEEEPLVKKELDTSDSKVDINKSENNHVESDKKTEEVKPQDQVNNEDIKNEIISDEINKTKSVEPDQQEVETSKIKQVENGDSSLLTVEKQELNKELKDDNEKESNENESEKIEDKEIENEKRNELDEKEQNGNETKDDEINNVEEAKITHEQDIKEQNAKEDEKDSSKKEIQEPENNDKDNSKSEETVDIEEKVTNQENSDEQSINEKPQDNNENKIENESEKEAENATETNEKSEDNDAEENKNIAEEESKEIKKDETEKTEKMQVETTNEPEQKENVSEDKVKKEELMEAPTQLTSAQQLQQNKNNIRWPKDRVLQMRIEQICYTVEKNEWPSMRHSFFSLLSGQIPSSSSIADSSPRPLSPCSLSSVSREPTPHPTPEHTPRREVMSPLPDFYYPGDNSVLNDSASRRRRRRRRRYEVEAERAKLRNLLSQTIEQQLPNKNFKQSTSLLSNLNSTSQFVIPSLFNLPFSNLRSSLQNELLNDDQKASLLLGSSLQSSLAAAAAAAAQSASMNSSSNQSSGGGPPPAHQNSAPRRNNPMGTLDLTGRFKSTPTIAPAIPTPAPAPAHKPKPKDTVLGADVLDLSSAAPVKRTRGNSPGRSQKPVFEEKPSAPVLKKGGKKIGSRIDALALNLQAKKMMEEKQTDKPDKSESSFLATEKRKQTLFLEELEKHSKSLQSKSLNNPPAAHSGSSSKASSSESLLNKTLSLAGLDASKLPPSKANEASSIAEQVALLRQSLRTFLEEHPEVMTQNPNMVNLVASSAANVFNPNMSINPLSSISANVRDIFNFYSIYYFNFYSIYYFNRLNYLNCLIQDANQGKDLILIH